MRNHQIGAINRLEKLSIVNWLQKRSSREISNITLTLLMILACVRYLPFRYQGELGEIESYGNNEVFEFAISLPPSLRERRYVYRVMLLREFPALFESVVWLPTGAKVNDRRSLKLRGIEKWRAAASEVLRRSMGKRAILVDNAYFMRSKPVIGYVDEMLHSSDAIYPRFIERELVKGRWDEHVHGADHTGFIGRVLSLEIWLRKLGV